MKRSDSMAGLISMCPNSTGLAYIPLNTTHLNGCENGIILPFSFYSTFANSLSALSFQFPCFINKGMYSRELMEGFDEEECGQKKRRLGVNQVKALEKNFEVENKLEPDRKLKLAHELGLQPRQVAVWFQNRRARWKTKQLERDYCLLKATYDALKLNFDKLHSHNHSLLQQIRELKSKVDKSEEEAKFEKNGSSDSDSSAEDNNQQKQKFLNANLDYEAQFVKIEEHKFLGEESCTAFFSDDQPPTLHWYCSDQWNFW